MILKYVPYSLSGLVPSYGGTTPELLDWANKNTGCPVEFEFYINSK